jgi:DNA polymerase III alpha subunit
MRLDKYSNPIFNEQDIFEALYKGQKLSSDLFVEKTSEIKNLESQLGFSFLQPYPDDLDISLEGYDRAHQNNWFMPEEYKQMDIESFLVQHSAKENYPRLIEELEAFKARNMLDLLRWLKYFVDTCSKEGVVWGVGRGSSVASYVLYVIGVHNIDPIKYNLDWQEFLR